MNAKAQGFCCGHSLRMNGAGVAIEHNIGDAFFCDNLCKPCIPLCQRPTIGDIALRAKPEGAVARVKPDTPNARARTLQHFPQKVKKRPVRPLQKQENAVITSDFAHMSRAGWNTLDPFINADCGENMVNTPPKASAFLQLACARASKTHQRERQPHVHRHHHRYRHHS